MVRMQVIRRGNSPLQRPFLFRSPVSAHVNPAFGRLVCITTAHHKDAHWPIFFSVVLDALQPAVHPREFELPYINFGLRSKLSLSRDACSKASVCPWPHGQ